MKIDCEITVDVSNADIETKKRVQDAFFKLGLTWWDGAKYACLDSDCYTNKTKTGKVKQDLMWTDTYMKPTHTIGQLLELAGMKTKTDLIPFDLEKALAGDQVVTRDGREVSQVTLFECEEQFPIRAVINGEIEAFTKTGEYFATGESYDLDLFMKPKTRIINGFEVPAPETKAPDYGTKYYFPLLGGDDFFEWRFWEGDAVDNRILSRNILFLTKEAAIENSKAMLGIDPYRGE